MKQIRSQILPFERMTREPEHFFFGYYDLQPWSPDGAFHLCNRVGFMDRMQTCSDRAELGMIRQYDNAFLPLAVTHAWNFQQGSMLQWNPANGREILHNAFLRGEFKGVAQNIDTGERRVFARPFSNVSPDGRHALSVNFSRLFDFRPGYGYAGIPDSNAAVDAPEDDGIFLLDMADRGAELILSLREIQEIFTAKFHRKDPKILVNHITFNTSGDRFVALVRDMPKIGEISKDDWLTLVFTADLHGKNIHVFNGGGYASHYIWRDPEHLLIYSDNAERGRMDLCLLTDRTDEVSTPDREFFRFDGHCSYSPDKRFILYDSYPDADGFRSLYLYDLDAHKCHTLAELFSGKRPLQYCEDMRCDLHPRWNRDGKMISFDSTHEGHRHIYRMDVSSLF